MKLVWHTEPCKQNIKPTKKKCGRSRNKTKTSTRKTITKPKKQFGADEFLIKRHQKSAHADRALKSTVKQLL